MKQFLGAAALGALALVTVAADAQVKQTVTGPVSTYWMTAETVSGFGGMAGRGGLGMASAMMNGGMGAAAHKLHLQLGSSRKAPGEPSAEHQPPAALRAGSALPLVTPHDGRAGTGTSEPWDGRMELPKGKILIYWGCGEKARPGQPVVIDFAKLAAGQVPAMAAINVKGMRPPSAGRHPTYGEWPNDRSRATVPANGSLVGEHVVRGNYTPDIRFALSQANDFLAPVAPTNAALPSGAVRVVWRPVANAKAYFAGVMGATKDETLVMWSSSELRLPGMSLPDFMAQDDIARLVQQKVLMGPQTSECAVPAEVARALEGGMLQMTAFGPEANFSYPPRPSDPKIAWNIEWTAKVRAKSTHMGLLGVEMGDMAGADAPDEVGEDDNEMPVPTKRRGLLRGLGGVIGSLPN